MSCAHLAWLSMGSTDRPMIFTPRRSNSGLMLAMQPSSVVQTGVKSRGCENSTPHESPSQSWNLMRPSVVLASKSGAVEPSWIAIVVLLNPGQISSILLPRRRALEPAHHGIHAVTLPADFVN